MKKLLGLVLAVFFIFGGIIWFDPFGFSGNLNYEEEERFTRLQISEGDVLVNKQKATDGQILLPGDRIQTAKETQASVLFFDDSVTRLAESTTVSLIVLNSDDYYAGKAEIELGIEKGEAWTNVPTQTAKDYTFGVSTRDVHATIRGTTLNVIVAAETSVVQAANHSIEVRAAGKLEGESDLLLQEGEEIEYGSLVVVEDEDSEETPKVGVRRVIAQADLERNWFKENGQEDRLYERQILSERLKKQQENVGALPGTLGYRIKRVREAVKVQVASDIEKENLQQAVLERRFAEAQMLKEAGNNEAAKKQSLEATASLERLSQTNAEVAQKIIIRQQEIIKTSLPGDSAYFLKKDLRDLEQKVASDADKDLVEQQNLKRSILEVYDAEKEESTNPVELNEAKENLRIEIKALPKSTQQELSPTLPYILKKAELEQVLPPEIEADTEILEPFESTRSEEEIARLEAEALEALEVEAEGGIEGAVEVSVPLVEEPVIEEVSTTNGNVNGRTTITVTPGGRAPSTPITPKAQETENENAEDALNQFLKDSGLGQ